MYVWHGNTGQTWQENKKTKKQLKGRYPTLMAGIAAIPAIAFGACAGLTIGITIGIVGELSQTVFLLASVGPRTQNPPLRLALGV